MRSILLIFSVILITDCIYGPHNNMLLITASTIDEEPSPPPPPPRLLAIRTQPSTMLACSTSSTHNLYYIETSTATMPENCTSVN